MRERSTHSYVFLSAYLEGFRFETEEYDLDMAVRKFSEGHWDRVYPYAVFRNGVVIARLEAKLDYRLKKMVPSVELWPEVRKRSWKFWS